MSPSEPFQRRRFLQTGALATAALTAAGIEGLSVRGQGIAAEEKDQPGEPGLLGKTPHSKFAVNIEMWWQIAVAGTNQDDRSLRLSGRRILALVQ